MENKQDLERTADALRDSVSAGAAANVDDILGEIMGGDGVYSPEYSDMISKYKTGPAAADDDDESAKPVSRSAFPRRDYTAEADEAIAAERRLDRSISRKMAPSVRDTVLREGQEVARPEFTYDGTVRYPTYGVGESGERVVYDADWENRAKEEAARISAFHPGASEHTQNSYGAQYRFTGAEEPPRRRAEPEEPVRAVPDSSRNYTADVPISRARAKAEVPDMEFKGIQNENLNIPPEFLAVKAREAAEEPAQPEDRGLAPEVQRTVDNAVLEAFSSDFDSDAAFKERWKDTVEKAQRRKEQLAKQQHQEETKQRSQEKLAVQTRRVAAMEEQLSETPPPAQKGYYSLRPEQPAAATAAAAAAAAVPMAEKLDAAVAERAHVPASQSAESTYKKTGSQKASFFMHSRFSKEGFKRFAHRNLPCKGDSGKEIVRKIIMDVSFVALVCALVYLAFYYRNYRARIKNDTELNSEIESGAEIPEYDLDNAWAEMRAMYPDVDFPEGMDIKFAKTYAMNSDTVGQLTIWEDKDGVQAKRIQTVILQNKTEGYYLYRDFYKKYSRYGSPYVSGKCRTGPEGLSKNTIIYGHNTHDHLIFNRLEDYMKVSGYVSAPIITLDTLYETTKWKIFAVMLTNADPADDNGNVFDYLYGSFSSDEAFLSKMKQIQARSMIHTGVDIQAGDKTLMLYTCYRSIFKSGRLVIVARQLREGESEEINTSLVYYDSSAIFPAAYYTGSPTTTAAPAASDTTRKNTSSENRTNAPEVTAAPDQTEAPEPAATDAPEAPEAPAASPPETDAVQGETGAGGGE